MHGNCPQLSREVSICLIYICIVIEFAISDH